MSTLFLLCGKIASGKSTLARELARRPGTLLVSEDHWMSSLFKDELRTIDDYDTYSERLRGAMTPLIVDILRGGLSVVLDFPANTVEFRQWTRGLFEEAGAAHELHVLDVPDEMCLERLRVRNSGGDHPFHVTNEEYRQFASYFVPPLPEEGFDVVVHRP